jgi:hypothetical protein
MSKPRSKKALALGVVAGAFASLLFPSRALAVTPFCDDATINPPLTNPVVIQSGDTQEPMLRAMSQKLRNSTAQQTSILYTTTGTCTIIANMYDPTKRFIAPNAVLTYAPSTLENPTWDPSQAPSTCIVNPATYPAPGIPIDIGIAATYTSSCTASPPPTDIAVFPGPIAGYGFIVPKASQQTYITAEQGYFVFGYGNNGMAAPWIDEHYMFTRLTTKSTELTIAANVGVSPVTKMKGTPFNGSTEVLNSVAQSPNPEKTIGILGTEIYDTNRDKVTELAFRAFQQRYAYLPDSSPTSFDKKNLRDGHYTPWAGTFYMLNVTAGTTTPTNANAKLFYDLVTGNTKLADVDGLGIAIKKGLVPQCAMTVTRDLADAAPLKGYTPAAPCACFFESHVPNGSTTCKACPNGDSDCTGTQKCRNAFCEVR